MSKSKCHILYPIDPSKVRIPAWSTHAKTMDLVFTWMTLTHVSVWEAMKENTVRQVGRDFLAAIFIPIVYTGVSKLAPRQPPPHASSTG
jgi:hypothetical protein